MLPDAVINGMGWQPPPVDASLSGMPDDVSGYGLHPAVLQGLGIQPPPPPPIVPISAAPAQPPPVDTSPDVNLPPPVPAVPPGPGPGAQLPSIAGQPTVPAPPPHDFHVAAPVAPAAVGAPPKVPAPVPAKPQSVEQAMASQQAQLDKANQEEKAAVAASTQTQLGQAADNLVAEQDYAAKEAELQKQAAAQRDEALKAHREAQQVVNDRMKALDNYKIDSSKYWNSMGMGDHIGWYIGIALSQIGNALMGKGGDNQVMQMLQDKMKQSIIMQQDQRDQMKEGVGRAKEAVQSTDLYQAKRAADIAAAQADATKMLKIQVDLATAKAADPQIRANGQMESAKLDRQLAQDQQTATEKLADYNIKKQSNAIAAGHLALANKQFNLDVAWKSWEQNKQQQQLDLAAAKEAMAERKAIGEKDMQLGVTATTDDGKGGATTGMLVQKNGDIWHANKPEEATKTQDMIAAATSYNRLIGRMIAGIKEHGGESSWLKSGDYQDMVVDLQHAEAELHKAYDIPFRGEGALKFLEKLTAGGVDPTSFVFNATRGLQRGARDLQDRVNDKLVAANYTGKPLSFAPLQPPDATSKNDQMLTALKDNRDGGMVGNVSAAILAAGGQPQLAAKVSGLAPKLALISTLAARVNERGPDANDAADMLAKVVANPDIAPQVRDAAEKALTDAVAKRRAGSFANSDKTFTVDNPGPVIGGLPDIIDRINKPPTLHPTITPTRYPGSPPGA